MDNLYCGDCELTCKVVEELVIFKFIIHTIKYKYSSDYYFLTQKGINWLKKELNKE